MRRALLPLFGALVVCSLGHGQQQLFILEMEHGELESAGQVADQHGYKLIRRLHSFSNIFVAEKLPQRRKRSLDDIVAEIMTARKINWAEPVTPFIREKRAVFSRANPQQPVSSLVESPNPHNLTGKGVLVAILDDGVDYSHPALFSSFRPEHSFDFVRDSQDPFPEDAPDNNHGTHCAGVVAMSPSSCGSGVAIGANIAALKMLGSTETMNDLVEGDALAYHHADIGIYSVSWGPRDDGKAAEAPRKLARMSLEKGATEGRKGKGSLYVWASGNGGLEADDCAMDGYASNKFTLTFGVVGSDGRPEWYAEGCPAVIAAVPSSSASRSTTEVGGGCAQFSGSSAAAPFAAGSLALILEAYPHLSQRDIQHLIVHSSQSAELVNINPGEWTRNGAGHFVSRYFGFGTLDTNRMLEMAEKWETVAEEKTCSRTFVVKSGVFSPATHITVPLRMNCQEVSSIERVQVEITIPGHPRRGDVHIQLTSPAGTQTDLLKPRRNDDSADGFTEWNFVSLHTWGETPQGLWTLRVEDVGRTTGGELTKTTVTIHGT